MKPIFETFDQSVKEIINTTPYIVSFNTNFTEKDFLEPKEIASLLGIKINYKCSPLQIAEKIATKLLGCEEAEFFSQEQQYEIENLGRHIALPTKKLTKYLEEALSELPTNASKTRLIQHLAIKTGLSFGDTRIAYAELLGYEDNKNKVYQTKYHILRCQPVLA